MKHFHQDLEGLQRHVLSLATAVEEMIHRAIQSLREQDLTLAREVIQQDADIDEQENRVNEECFQTIALHQPVAVDLRRIVSILQITTDLERMADLAVEIAERAESLAQRPPAPIPAKLLQMSNLVTSMVRQSLDAFVNQDAELARQVCRTDDDVDSMNKSIIDDLVAIMKRSPEQVEPALSLFSAVRHLERIADHATNIAEDVVYLVEGRIIRHHPEAINAP